jgi:peptidoglycan hydrolase FlgJ
MGGGRIVAAPAVPHGRRENDEVQIDAALLQYNNKPLRLPSGAAQVQASGARIADPSHVDKKSKLFEQCEEFEAIFVKMMLKEMRSTVDKSDSLISGGWAEDIYSDMLDDEYSKSMAKKAGFGLADQLYKQLAKAQ